MTTKINDIITLIKQTLYKPKAVNENKYKKSIISVSRDDIEFNIATSVVIKVQYLDKIYYFRACSEHKKIQKYVFAFIEEYYSLIMRGKYKTDNNRVLESLQIEDNFKKFIGMGTRYPTTSAYHRFFVDNEDPIIIGINGHNDKQFIMRLKPFVRYASNMLREYNCNHSIAFNNKRHFFHANRNFAFKALSDLLNCSSFSPNVFYGYLDIKGHCKKFGFFMDDAEGISVLSLSFDERKNRMSPIIQKNLINLNIVDYLCCIEDHTPRNYSVILDKDKKFINVRCFDNDDNSSFGVNERLFVKSYSGVRLVSEDGIIERDHIDREFADYLSRLKKIDLNLALKNHLRKKQIDRIWQRVIYLNTAIRQTKKTKRRFLISDDQWNEKTVIEELSRKNGKTYLTDFVTMREGPKVDIIH